jgi:hypothetical protein
VDDLLKKAFDIADRMEILSNQKSILKEEYNQNLEYYIHGGSFTASKELIVFVKTLIDLNNAENVVLVDNNNTPIQIPNLNDFLKEISNCYFSATNEYYTKYTNLVSKRTTESLVLDDE